MLARAFLLLSTFAIFHAAYSAYEHLARLKALGRPEGALPTSIVLETLIAMALGVVGASLNAPPLKEITWASEMKQRNIDDIDSRLGFANFDNRGKNILPAQKQKAS